LNHIYS